MFERFTERAIKVIMLAQEESRRLGHNFVGTESMLLGLIGEGGGIASRALRGAGVSLATARIEVEKIIGRGSGFVAVEIPFTPRAKKALESSWDVARRLGTNYIDTEHVLLGVLLAGDSVATRALDNMSIDRERLRRTTIAAAQGKGSIGVLPETPNVPATNLSTEQAFSFYHESAMKIIGSAGNISAVHGRPDISASELALAAISSLDLMEFAKEDMPNLAEIRKLLLASLSPAEVAPSKVVPFNDSAKRVLEDSWRLAYALKQCFVTDITMLLALVSLPPDHGLDALKLPEAQLTHLKQKLEQAAARTAVEEQQGDPLAGLADPLESIKFSSGPIVRAGFIAGIIVLLAMLLLQLTRF